MPVNFNYDFAIALTGLCQVSIGNFLMYFSSDILPVFLYAK